MNILFFTKVKNKNTLVTYFDVLKTNLMTEFTHQCKVNVRSMKRETDDIHRRKRVRRSFEDGNSRYQKKHP